MERGDTNPLPPVLHQRKKPSAYRVKTSYHQKCEDCDNLGLKSKFYQYLVFTKKNTLTILSHFASV